MIDTHFELSFWIFVVDVNISISYATLAVLVITAFLVLYPIIKRALA